MPANTFTPPAQNSGRMQKIILGRFLPCEFLWSLRARTAKTFICTKSGVSADSRKSTKKCAKPHFLCKQCANSEVLHTFWCSFWNRRKPCADKCFCRSGSEARQEYTILTSKGYFPCENNLETQRKIKASLSDRFFFQRPWGHGCPCLWVMDVCTDMRVFPRPDRSFWPA